MKALIFGSAGQDGYYLSELLGHSGAEVIGVSRSGGTVRGSVDDGPLVDRLIETHRPDYIFHFAANSTTRHDALYENHAAIATGSLHILESARRHSPASRIFLSGSALQFRNEGRPLDERAAFSASSPYAVDRIASVYAGRYFRETFGMRIFVGYFFNHDSPLRSERHVNQKIVRAAQRIDAGSGERLHLGAIDVKKEFNFAGDAMRAIWTLVRQDIEFEAMIGSGLAYSIREWTDYCFARIGRSWESHVTVEDRYVPEYRILVSDPSLIHSLGWQPAVDFTGLADMMLASPLPTPP